MLSLTVRLALIPWFSDSLNFYGYKLTTSFLEQGQNPWQVITSDPALALFNPWGYPPPFFLVTFTASLLSSGNGYVFGVLLRLPNVAADLITGLFLLRIGAAAGLTREKSIGLMFSYLFNPFVILVSSIWGTMDPLPVMFTTAALYFMIRKPRNTDMAGFLLGLGIAFKLYPAVIVPVAVAKLGHLRTGIRFVLLAALPFSVTSLPILLYSSREFFSILAGFSTGISSHGVESYLSVWWLLSKAGISVTPVAFIASEIVYLSILILLSWACVRNKLSFTRAATVAVLALFLTAPRLNENYFVWAIPFLLIMSNDESWSPRWRTSGKLLWIPLALSALLYNGLSVAQGFFYWGLISMGVLATPSTWLPSWTQPLLIMTFLVFLLASTVTLSRGQAPKSESNRSFSLGHSLKRLSGIGLKRTYSLTTALLLIAIISGATVGAYHHDVLPEHYGTYAFQSNQIVFTDEFDALLLGFTWQSGGTGIIRSARDSANGLTLDTVNSGGTAWIERLLPAPPLTIDLSFAVSSIYSAPGLLFIFRTVNGWLGITRTMNPDGTSSYEAFYQDNVTQTQQLLAPISLGKSFNTKLSITPTGLVIQLNTSVASAAWQVSTSKIQFGQTDSVSNAGGRFQLDAVQISRESHTTNHPVFTPATLTLNLLIVVLPILGLRLGKYTRGRISARREDTSVGGNDGLGFRSLF